MIKSVKEWEDALLVNAITENDEVIGDVFEQNYKQWHTAISETIRKDKLKYRGNQAQIEIVEKDGAETFGNFQRAYNELKKGCVFRENLQLPPAPEPYEWVPISTITTNTAKLKLKEQGGLLPFEALRGSSFNAVALRVILGAVLVFAGLWAVWFVFQILLSSLMIAYMILYKGETVLPKFWFVVLLLLLSASICVTFLWLIFSGYKSTKVEEIKSEEKEKLQEANNQRASSYIEKLIDRKNIAKRIADRKQTIKLESQLRGIPEDMLRDDSEAKIDFMNDFELPPKPKPPELINTDKIDKNYVRQRKKEGEQVGSFWNWLKLITIQPTFTITFMFGAILSIISVAIQFVAWLFSIQFLKDVLPEIYSIFWILLISAFIWLWFIMKKAKDIDLEYEKALKVNKERESDYSNNRDVWRNAVAIIEETKVMLEKRA